MEGKEVDLNEPKEESVLDKQLNEIRDYYFKKYKDTLNPDSGITREDANKFIEKKQEEDFAKAFEQLGDNKWLPKVLEEATFDPEDKEALEVAKNAVTLLFVKEGKKPRSEIKVRVFENLVTLDIERHAEAERGKKDEEKEYLSFEDPDLLDKIVKETLPDEAIQLSDEENKKLSALLKDYFTKDVKLFKNQDRRNITLSSIREMFSRKPSAVVFDESNLEALLKGENLELVRTEILGRVAGFLREKGYGRNAA